MSKRLEGKTAIVTGGASGIGEATCLLMAAEGAQVVVTDIQDERGEAVAASIGEAARYRNVDVTSEEAVAGVIDEVVSDWGRLDCMFNNAGIVGAVGPIDEMPLEEWQFTMDVLLKSVFLGSKHAARYAGQSPKNSPTAEENPNANNTDHKGTWVENGKASALVMAWPISLLRVPRILRTTFPWTKRSASPWPTRRWSEYWPG